MPKLGEMAQLSRPYQIALLALATLVLVWFVALHRPGGGSSSPSVASSSGGSSAGSSSAGSSSAGSSSAGGSSAAGTSSVYHGAAPGVEGLTKDIQKAHGAVSTSQSNAQELQRKSAQASGEAASGGVPAAGASHGANSAAPTHAGASVGKLAGAAAPAGSHTQTHSSASAASSSASRTIPVIPQRTPRAQSGSAAAAPSKSTPAMQTVLAGELKRGKVVLLLFWNPSSSDDVAVNHQVQAVAHKSAGHVAVHIASASQVGSFGSITRDIQVYQTPTLLIVNPDGQVTTLTGYTDAYAIEQAITEAQVGTKARSGRSR